MTKDNRYTERAARAAGEPMPGSDPTRPATEPAGEQQDLDRLVALLRSAELPPSEDRREAVLDCLKKQPRTGSPRRVALIAASLLVLLIPVYLIARPDPKPQVLSPPGAGVARASVFGEVFVPHEWQVQDSSETPLPQPGGPAGDSPEFLGPFADQVDFPLLVPVRLPKGIELMAARYRRERPVDRPFPFLWLEYAGPGGQVIVLQAPDGPGAKRAIDALSPPGGWQVRHRSAEGVLALVATRKLSKQALENLAGGLTPLTR